jgi:putative sterol carrier protein
MASHTDAFFEALAQRKHVPGLAGHHATIRFELTGGRQVDHWTVAIDDGDLVVTPSSGDADCVIYSDVKLFDRITSGETNPFAAVLRGALLADGSAVQLVAARRLFATNGGGSNQGDSDQGDLS